MSTFLTIRQTRPVIFKKFLPPKSVVFSAKILHIPSKIINQWPKARGDRFHGSE